jgi:CheY-like chemotaxis protein
MSHELRTPMNAILGFSQLLELDRALSQNSQRYVKETLRAGNHLLDLINDVLDLEQVESGQLTLSTEALPLAEVGHEVLMLMQPLAEQRGVTLTPAAVDGLVVRADRTRLKQVLVNLVGNAVKYNRPAGSVEFDAVAVNRGTIRIAVRDTGLGIAPERLPQLFEPFNRLGAELGSIEGTGIGLSICRRLVDLMGGQIGATSTLGSGSEFWIELPRDRAAALRPVRADAMMTRRPAVAPERVVKVLYIEDNPVNVILMEAMLSRLEGVEVSSTPSPLQGLQMARDGRPSLILLDIQLPGMDGFEVLRRLRAREETCLIPVIAVTANAMQADVDTALAAGFDAYLTKPIELDLLIATVQRVLQASGALSPA